MRSRFTAGLLTVTLAASMVALGAPAARAGSKGRKNTALGLGALAVYELLRGKTGTGLLAGAGAAYAYKRYSDARKNERRYRPSYGSLYQTGNGGYQNPAQYSNTAYYGRSGYSNGQSGYYGNNGCRPRGGSYTTDEGGNRHYYNSRYSDGYHRYASSYSSTADRGRNCPPGQYHGRQRGRR